MATRIKVTRGIQEVAEDTTTWLAIRVVVVAGGIIREDTLRGEDIIR